MQTIWEALSGTPWWVYVLFFYLLKVGINASKTRVISLKKLFILPIIFLAFSIHTLLTEVETAALIIAIWLGALVVGGIIGFLQIKCTNLSFDKQNHTVTMPGTWITLIVILVIFASKYYFGYELAMNPMLGKQIIFESSLVGISGIISGLFIGRLLTLLYRYQFKKG